MVSILFCHVHFLYPFLEDCIVDEVLMFRVSMEQGDFADRLMLVLIIGNAINVLG